MKLGKFKNGTIAFALMVMLAMTAACTGEQIADNVLKSSEATYKTAHQLCLDVAYNPDLTLEQKKAFKAKVQPVMRTADGLIRTGLIAFKTYKLVDASGGNSTDTPATARAALFDVAKELCAQIPQLVYAVNTAAKGFGYDSLVVPEEISNAFK